MAYSQEVIEEAYQAYLQARTIEGAAMMVDVPGSTVYKWFVKYEWEKRLNQDLQKVDEDPFGEGALVAKRFDFSEQEKQTLIQATILEGICLACIRGEKEKDPETELVRYKDPRIEALGLKPRSFVEASATLEKCWKARNEVLSRNMNKNNKNAIDGEIKEDYVAEVKRLSQKKG